MQLILISAFILSIFKELCSAQCGCSQKGIKIKDLKVGDMILSKNDILLINGFKASQGLRWPNNEVKYTFDPSYPDNNKVTIRNLLKIYEKELGNCVKFIESTNGAHAIVGTGERCSSSIGYNPNGNMYMTLPGRCVNERNVKHEFSHLLGFMHEHSRPDRDNHLEIFYDNVLTGACNNFYVCRGCTITTNYDFSSIMQYPSSAFSCNRKHSMLRRHGNDRSISWNMKVSETDVKRVRDYYKC